jgi:hypothetical protein
MEANEEQTQMAINGVFASLLGGLTNNMSSDTGLRALKSALDRDHDGSILDDVAGMINSMAKGNINESNNGPGIIGHIFGNRQQQIAQQIGASAGLNSEQIMKIMPVLAPIVMAVIGKMKRSNISQQTASGAMGDWTNIITDTASAVQQNGFGDIISAVLSGGPQEPTSGNTQNASENGGILGTIFGTIFKR